MLRSRLDSLRCLRAACGVAIAASAPLALAQSAVLPDRAVRVVVGSPAAASPDLVMRLLAPVVQQELGQPVVVDPRPGADGIIAAELAARSPADGSVVMLATFTQLVSNPALRNDLPYDVERDFVPVTLVSDHHHALVAHPSFPARDLAALRERALAAPGSVDVAAPSSTFRLVAESLAQAMGARFTVVPYNGMTAAYQAVLAGQVPLAVVDASIALDAIRAGRLHALAVGARTRLDLLPDVSTFPEAGYPSLDMTIFIGLVAPARVPPEIVDRWRAAVHRALAAPGVRERLASMAASPRPTTGAEMARAIRDDRAWFAREARRAGMTVN